MFPLPKGKRPTSNSATRPSRYALVGVFVAKRPFGCAPSPSPAPVPRAVFRVTAFEEALKEALLAEGARRFDGFRPPASTAICTAAPNIARI